MVPLIFLDTKTHFLIQEVCYTWKKKKDRGIGLFLSSMLAAQAEGLSSDPCVHVRSQTLAWPVVANL